LVGQGHRCLPAASAWFSITVRQTKSVAGAITAIDEAAWVDIDYPEGGQA
jgi:hypothetical protein